MGGDVQPAQASLTGAVAESRLAGLAALRDRLADEIDVTDSARDLSSLSQRLMEVLAQIDELDPPRREEVTGLDEFTERLRARQSEAKGAGRAEQA